MDGCYVKGPIPRQILTTIGIDPNNQIFFVAYAVVKIESKVNWSWFIDLLISDLDVVNTCGWTFIIDK